MQVIACALALALERAGKSIAARIAMIAMTTSNSISVKPPLFLAVRTAPALLLLKLFIVRTKVEKVAENGFRSPSVNSCRFRQLLPYSIAPAP
jgi:hypothetical protein